jgi:dTDP-4-amino-4,6-dideoxygalactose transaminase
MQLKVPFLDLKLHHAPLRVEIDQAIGEVIDRGTFAGGPFVAEFENDFAAFCGSQQAIGLGSGTDALWLALLACGVGPGDEVITVPNTFMATAEAITYAGAKPVFVDVDERTYTMDPALLGQALTARTKAVIPVHLFGQVADMEPILSFGRKNRLYVIEDAAQGQGAEYKGRKAGSIGDIGCFSFYPGKNLGAFGEAGAVVTNNAALQEKIRILRDHGQIRKYHHSIIGWNCRMDGIQAAVLRIKLRHLDQANHRRRAHARHYDELFSGSQDVVTPYEASYGRHNYHIYAIRVQERDEVMRLLEEKGIGCAIHYPIPIHLQQAYRSLGYAEGAFPVSERLCAEFISLPMFPELTERQVELVVTSVKECLVVGAVL